LARRRRIDLLLVERGLAPTRTKAQALLLAGQVVVDDRRVDKPGRLCDPESAIRLKAGAALRYVSRGGLKLEAALDHFDLAVAGLCCADLGASTGGFTDCLLQRGAARVHACDVGRGQLDPRLARDPRVVVHDRVNARYLTPEFLGERVAFCTIDASFISLAKLLPAARSILEPEGTLVALIKPQFEVGRGAVGRGGVVRDPEARAAAVATAVASAERLGFRARGTIDSPVKGPAGNVEALLVALKVEV
jgi:23S rRNA (cytidine1920-2'-O)/16S rRNA (cytidine1409-2'-O)-methyltransferase